MKFGGRYKVFIMLNLDRWFTFAKLAIMNYYVGLSKLEENTTLTSGYGISGL